MRLMSVLVTILFLFNLLGCGVKGDPLPMSDTEKIGTGVPKAKRLKIKAGQNSGVKTAAEEEAERQDEETHK